MTRSILIGLLFLVGHSLPAAPGDSEAAFDAFKDLAGIWTIQSEGKTLSIKMSYEVASNGSIVTEQFGKELSVFYRDGQDLLMTHFCNGGNQPRLRLNQTRQPGLWEFQMFDVTNLKSPSADHVQRVIYKMVDPKRIELEIVWKVGESQKPEKYTLLKL